MAAVARTIVFIHGAWVTNRCWDPMVGYFTDRGYHCLAPAWPGKDRSVDEIRRDPSPLVGLGVSQIVSHYERIIRELDEPPILIGHSFGGLFTQILLDRGLGAAGVAIDSAPPRGVFAYQPTALRSFLGVLLTWGFWNKAVRWSQAEFAYAFVHTLPPAVQAQLYEQQVTSESGRLIWEAAIAPLKPRSPILVNFANPSRAPLLLIAGEQDRVVPAVVVRHNVRHYAKSPAVTDFRVFPSRVHWIIAQPGWEEVAAAIYDWLAATLPA
jgi:pimeloyl-ACP methyl ester carboxylesterase